MLAIAKAIVKVLSIVFSPANAYRYWQEFNQKSRQADGSEVPTQMAASRLMTRVAIWYEVAFFI